MEVIPPLLSGSWHPGVTPMVRQAAGGAGGQGGGRAGRKEVREGSKEIFSGEV